MNKHKNRITTTIAVLAAVLGIALSIQLISEPKSTGSDRRVDEIAVAPAAHEQSASDEPTLLQPSDSSDDGLFSSVEWRDRWEENLEAYPRTYAELRELAEQGDAGATRRLVGLLSSCQHATLPVSDTELDEIVAQMRTSYSLPTLTDGRLEFLPETTGDLANLFESRAELDAFIDKWASNTRTCTTVTVEQRGEVEYWLGVLQAQDPDTEYTRRPPEKMNRDDKIAYLESAWATGDPHALAELASIYSDYDVQITNPSARVRAFAYIYTYYRAAIESARYHSETERLAQLQWALKSVTSNYEGSLSDHQITDAYQLARQTVEDNENCCIRLPATGN